MTLGGISVVIGVLALMFSLGLSMCCFLLSWASVPFSAIGLTLGVIGLIVPLATKSRGIALPIAGISVNGLALLAVLLSQVFGFRMINQQMAVAPPNPAIVTQPKKTIAPPIDTVTDGDVKVMVASVERVAGERLAIRLKVQNVSKQRVVTLKSWEVGKDVATLHWMDADENEHPLELVEPRPNQKPETRFNRDVTVEETLTFEVPPDDFVILNLELPAANYGGTGKIRFVIQNDKVKK